MYKLRRSIERFFSDIIKALTGQDPRRGFSLAIFTVTTLFVIDNLVNLYQIWAVENTIGQEQIVRHVLLPLIVAALVWLFVQRNERIGEVISDGKTITPHRGY